jgi:hypothetical protein
MKHHMCDVSPQKSSSAGEWDAGHKPHEISDYWQLPDHQKMLPTNIIDFL